MKSGTMMDEKKRKHLYDSIYSYVMNDVACMMEVDNEKRTYHVLECEEYFRNIFKQNGSLRDLYRIMFSNSEQQPTGNTNMYDSFIDEEVFKKERYQGSIHFQEKGEEKDYFFCFLKISPIESIILFFEEGFFAQSNMLELEKIDTIQESYLFSMMVDLSNDSCVNPNTTETNASRQDFSDIKYSDWRIMISNMFKEEDKVLFLRASSPENVINMLEMQNQFHVDLQMLNMQGRFIWCRLKFARMKNFSRENPRFV